MVADATSAPVSSNSVADATPYALSSSSQSDAPVLMWSGDLGSYIGTSNGSGTAGAGGTGSTGSSVQSGASSSGLIINVDYDASVANAPVGFTTAVSQVVSYFESHFSDPITITIDVGYGEIQGQSLASGALGESETALTSVSYSQLENALVTNADAIGDTAAPQACRPPAQSVVLNIGWRRPKRRHWAFPAPAPTLMAMLDFSSAYNFAYNDSNGVAANQYDFFGVVAHEFSEVMGRQMFDGGGGNVYEPLDLFHYSAPGVRDFSGTTAGYASANGGATNLDSFNTNPNGDFGDWAGSAGHDAFLAFTGSGAVNSVSASDLTLMNLLGLGSKLVTGDADGDDRLITRHRHLIDRQHHVQTTALNRHCRCQCER